MASKGCYWSKCNFCTYASIQGHGYALADAKTLVGTIEALKHRYKINNFKFVDDALPCRLMKDLAHLLCQKGLHIGWSGSIILEEGFLDPELCGMLKASGLSQVSIGLESAVPRVLNVMNKKHKDLGKELIRNILYTIKSSGIKIGLHIIFGFPGETKAEARDTLRFLIDNKELYDMCMFQPFCLEDDTPLFKKPGNFGISNIHLEDKDCGERLGYRYDVKSGMSQLESAKFTYKEAFQVFKKAGISAKCNMIGA